VRLPREAEGRVRALAALEQGPRRPVRPRGFRFRNETVDGLECAPPELSDVAEGGTHDLHVSSRRPRLDPLEGEARTFASESTYCVKPVAGWQAHLRRPSPVFAAFSPAVGFAAGMVALALGAAVQLTSALRPELVERFYSQGVFPIVQ